MDTTKKNKKRANPKSNLKLENGRLLDALINIKWAIIDGKSDEYVLEICKEAIQKATE